MSCLGFRDKEGLDINGEVADVGFVEGPGQVVRYKFWRVVAA